MSTILRMSLHVFWDQLWHWSYGIDMAQLQNQISSVQRWQNKMFESFCIIKKLANATKDPHKELRILKVVDAHKLFILRLVYQHETFKLPTGITFKEYFKVRNKIHNRDTRNNWKLNILKAKTNYGYNSIKVVCAKLYNQVPEDHTNGEKKNKATCLNVFTIQIMILLPPQPQIIMLRRFLFNKWYDIGNLFHYYTNQVFQCTFCNWKND